MENLEQKYDKLVEEREKIINEIKSIEETEIIKNILNYKKKNLIYLKDNSIY